MRVLIATGGTGGHIYPAVALANQLIKTDNSVDLMFVGNNDRMEHEIIPELGFRFVGIDAPRFNSSDVNKVQAVKLLYKSYKNCLTIVADYDPDIIIGFGGYVTVPVILAGKKLGVKTVIHEQNSLAGMANRTLGYFVSKVITVYQSAMAAFPSRKVVCLGNPRESAVLDFNKDKYVLKQFDLDTTKKTLLIVMGSLGSQSVNEKMIGVLEEFKTKAYNVIYVTGKNNFDDFRTLIADSDNVKIVPYIDQFTIAGNCDLIVSRGGATSACEYMALGLPSIIIPSPYVPNNHQFLNAKEMMDNNACLILEEKDLSVEKLTQMVDELLNDDLKLQNMSQKAKMMSHPHAAEDFVKLIYEMVGKR